MKATIFAALCFAAGWAMADQTVIKVYSLSVQERLENLELIDISAEKRPVQDEVGLDEELADILREVEALEQAIEQDDS